MKEKLRATEEDAPRRPNRYATRTRAESKQSDLAKINHELSDRSMMAESRHDELVAVPPRSKAQDPRRRRRKGIRHDPGAARAGAGRIRKGDARARRGAAASKISASTSPISIAS